MLNTGPNLKYGFAIEGEQMRYAHRRKTIADAVLAIRHGKRIVAWDAPGNLQSDRAEKITQLKADIETTLANAEI